MADSSVIDLRPQKPIGLVHNNVMTTSAPFVVSSIKREIYPTAQVNYTPTTNNILEFRLSSADMFLKEAWLQFDLGVTSNDKWVSFEEGGASQLFSRVELLDISGRQLHVMEQFDLERNLASNLKMKKSTIENKMWSQGDGPDKPWIDGEWEVTSLAATNINAAADSSLLTFAHGANDTKTADLCVGLPIRLRNKTNNQIDYHGYIMDSVDSGNNTEVRAYPPIHFALTNNTTYVADIGRKSPRYELATPSKNYEVVMPLDFSIFSLNEDIPLFLFDGLMLRFTLQPAYYAFNTINIDYSFTALSNSKTLSYSMDNVRLVAIMRKGSAEIMADYRAMYTGPGIDYVFPAYHVINRQENGNEANAYNFDLPISKASVRRVLFVVQNALSKSSTNSADNREDVYSYPNKTYIDGKISSYQFQVGGINYPQLEVNTDDDVMTQAFEELKRAMGVRQNPLVEFRFGFEKWSKKNLNNLVTPTSTESKKAIFGTTFSTVDYDMMTGIRTKGRGTDNHIICDITLSGTHQMSVNSSNVASTRYFTFLFEYAKVLRLNVRSGVITLE